jgi:hypothetical protein
MDETGKLGACALPPKPSEREARPDEGQDALDARFHHGSFYPESGVIVHELPVTPGAEVTPLPHKSLPVQRFLRTCVFAMTVVRAGEARGTPKKVL